MPTTIVMSGPGTTTLVDDAALAIAAQTAALEVIAASNTLQMDALWGAAAVAIPGSPRNSLANISTQLATLNDNLMTMKEQQRALTGALGEFSNTMKAQNAQAQKMEVLQTMAITDQIETNRFTKAETVAALQRNGIDPQPQPPILDTLKEHLKTSTQFGLAAELQSSVQSMARKALEGLKTYILESTVVTWGQAQLTSLWAYLKLNKLTSKAANPIDVANDKIKKTSIESAKIGVWVPVPPFIPDDVA